MKLQRIYRRFAAKLQEGILVILAKNEIADIINVTHIEVANGRLTIGEKVFGSKVERMTNFVIRDGDDFEISMESEEVAVRTTWFADNVVQLGEIAGFIAQLKSLSLGKSGLLGPTCWVGIEPDTDVHPEWVDIRTKKREARKPGNQNQTPL